MYNPTENIDTLSPVICLNKIIREDIRCDEAKRCLKEQLKERLDRQLTLLLDEQSQLNQEIIKSILQSELDWTIRTQVWPRIQNSLSQLRKFTFFHDTNDIPSGIINKLIGDNLLELIFSDLKKECLYVTTPALLVVQALLLGHQEWIRPYYHDVWSAGYARKSTWLNNIPLEFVNKVAIMIAFLNTCRNSFSQINREVVVWDNNEKQFNLDKNLIENALVREIIRFWKADNENDSKIALSSVAACSLSHEKRGVLFNAELSAIDQSGSELSTTQLENIFSYKCKAYARLYKRSFDQEDLPNWKLLNNDKILCSFEFGNYIFDSPHQLTKFAEKFATPDVDLSSTSMIFFSLGRFWSNREINNFQDKYLGSQDNYQGPICWEKDPQRQILLESLDDTNNCTQFAHLDIRAVDRFELYFGKKLPTQLDNDSCSNIWKWIGVGIQWANNHRRWKFDDAKYLPVSAVDRVLRAIERIRPDCFLIGRITWREQLLHPGINSHGYTIALPIDCPSIEDLNSIYKRRSYSDPKMIVARYAATAILNQRMAYGSGLLNLFLDTDYETAEKWYQAIEWVETKNRHETLRYYLDQVFSPFYSLAKNSNLQVVYPEQDGDLQALCVDIGASSIKVELWLVDSTTLEFKQKLNTETPCQYSTSPGEGKRYNGGTGFAQILKDHVVKHFTGFDPNKLCFIGIGWPGAIAGEIGSEYVAGTSGILNYFEGVTNQILGNSTKQIHSLKIREGFEEIFRRDDRKPVLVRLINDGEAHTRASLQQLPKKYMDQGCKVTLTAGTGTALGVIPVDNNTPLNILAEVGKFVINLLASFPDTYNFPSGVANKIYSMHTIQIIAKDLAKDKIKIDFDRHRVLSNIQPLVLCYMLSSLKSLERTRDNVYLQKWFAENLINSFQNFEIQDAEGDVIATFERVLSSALGIFPSLRKEDFPINILDKLKNKFNFAERSKLDLEETFGFIVAYRAGCLLADLIALCADLFQADILFCTGGPMKGFIGELIREFARYELEQFYSFKVAETDLSTDDTYRLPHFVRGLVLPEPESIEPEQAPSGAWGAGSAALERYKALLKNSELHQLEDTLRSLVVKNIITQGTRIEINIDNLNKKLHIKLPNSDCTVSCRFLEIKDVGDFLDTHRVRRGLYRGEITDGIYSCIFVGPPDSILRH